MQAGLPEGKAAQRFQCTAIDDAARIRALRIYRPSTKKNVIDIAEYIIRKFLFRIHNGGEAGSTVSYSSKRPQSVL